ncbi:rod-binding protein [Citreimonas sp.]|uniref:rod-binding protein n=1 Tax=Citreimonas sp. TaxID=3036715 RepID=UPI0040592130
MQITPSPSAPPAQQREQALRDVAQKLEATFLSEMLKSAGLGKTPEGFGGGSGEDQFASFLRDEHAKAIAARGGIGLAETLFNALKGRADD